MQTIRSYLDDGEWETIIKLLSFEENPNFSSNLLENNPTNNIISYDHNEGITNCNHYPSNFQTTQNYDNTNSIFEQEVSLWFDIPVNVENNNNNNVCSNEICTKRKVDVGDESACQLAKAPMKKGRSTSGHNKNMKVQLKGGDGPKTRGETGEKELEVRKKLRLSQVKSDHNNELNESEESESSKALISTRTTTGKKRASRGEATDPQSLYARRRRNRINERLRTLQSLVPNGTKVDISTMLEEAFHYVKFLQLQIRLLSCEDAWIYTPVAYSRFDVSVYGNIFPK